ncbi:MAG: hypothetical protein L7U58_03085, partial [Planktomarina sp.]|nr:hypothetical protein [Planktomarina sp.]
DFYALAVEKLQAFGTLFQGHEIELSICMRDPGTFIPAAYGKSHGRSFQRLMAGAAPLCGAMVWLDPSHAHCLAQGQDHRLVQ